MKILSTKPRSRRSGFAAATLIAGVLASAFVGVAPASAIDVGVVNIELDCHYEGDISVTADPGDLLVFHYVPRTDTCPEPVGGTFYINDFNNVDGQQAKGGFLGEMGNYVEGIYTDFNPSSDELNTWWGINQGAYIAAPLRALGGAVLESGNYLPATEELVAGESVIGVLETNWHVVLLNRFIWAGPRTVVPVVADMGLPLEVGSDVAGTPVTFSGSGLRPGSKWEVAVHSTPTVIASGIVSEDGTYTGTGVMPEGLEAGVHSIIANTTNADGTTSTNTIVLAIGEDGSLLYKSEPIANTDEAALTQAGAEAEAAVVVAAATGSSVAALAATGTDGALTVSLGGGALALLLAGVALSIRRRAGSITA
jgi:hypothetical protein